ncbi:MAG TPA: ATPase, T2SS/T4P/T4SS family [Phycisphaerae bacterium]|nr:ATPase, T2SS/T4P/T4SS family [Phycisphaerae bacterium]
MTVTTKRIRIGEVLVEEGILSPEQLDRALAQQKATGQFLGEMLVEQDLVSHEDLVRVLAKRLGVRGCRLRTGMADPSLLDLIGEQEAIRLKALPMFKVRSTLTVAMAEPQSLPNVDRLRQLTGCEIRPLLALEGNIIEFIRKFSRSSTEIDTVLASLAETDVEILGGEPADDGTVTDLDRQVDGSPVVSLVNMVLLRAVRDRASDVHIEPDKQATRIRYRIDGILRDLMRPPVGMHAAIVARIKVTGRMDIGEKRLPQEGRIRLIAEGREIDLRISSMPTVLGEKIVVRILDKANLTVRLEDLGFRPEALASFIRMLRQPYGMILVTGPTGSGKTTTLYSALSLLRSPERNIVTVENPVEYQLDLINQIQVQESIGMTFARALRSILRQDPDVIMVGEIRDEETARVAVQAALTGHLVLATLHTNDAPGAAARLVDMGVQPYLLSSALNGVAAQRLVRTVCPHCSEKYHPEENVLRDAGLADKADQAFTRGAGCQHCHDSGFSGRTGTYEVMELTSELRRMIHKGASSQELCEKWQSQGGMTLRQEGVLVALEGKTSLEEVLCATHGQSEVLPPSAG